MKAKRYNAGKPRVELLSQIAIDKIIDVYTKGAFKYSDFKDDYSGNTLRGMETSPEEVELIGMKMIDDGANNWRRGQKWSQTMASVKRHIAAWDRGEDNDPDLGTHHLANAAWGLMALLEFEDTHPQLDDRNHWWLTMPKVGLDIDEVLCDWVAGWTEHHDMKVPAHWHFDRAIAERFERMKNNGSLEPFYMDLEPKISPDEIPFEPHCYVTSRMIPNELTEMWLDKHDFPARPVYTVPMGSSKVQAIKDSGAEVFVDDCWDNFVEINKAGIVCYLMDAPHNQRYDVGNKRIKHLRELLK